MTHPIVGYLATMNLDSAADRAERLTRLVAEDVRYLDPHAPEAISGREALAALLSVLRERLPHLRVERVGEPDTHHEAFRQQWRMIAGETVFSAGVFVGTTAEDGRIQVIIGFIDQPPA
jgi:hypothetical protein